MMRTSRVSKEASKLFDRASSPSTSTSPTRRITRSSLARFAYGTDNSTRDESSATPDIEDAVPHTSAVATPARKRRRVTPSSPAAAMVKSEVVEETSLDAIASPPAKKPARGSRKPARKVKDASTGETTVAPPSHWEEMYDGVRRMRAPGGAAYPSAVDTMGCERLADRSASPKDQRFHTLIALMLSSQTKDTVNSVAMKKLQSELPAHKPGAPVGLNLDNVLAVDPKLLNEMIWQVGFHNNKTKYIKKAAEILRDEWKGDIPDTIEGLTALPGVGPKMAYLCLSAAWDRTEGIGVDVHVHRITNMWGWNKTKTPEETRLALQSWLPRDRWREINFLLVGFGQTVCLPVGRKCGNCDLGLEGLCKAAERKKVIQGRRVKKEEEQAVKFEEDGDGGVVKEEVVKKEEVEEKVIVKEEVVDEET